MPVFKNEGNETWYVMARYVNWKGERKQKCKRGFATKKEAKEWERMFQLQNSSDMDMSFEAFTELYIRDMKSRLKENTWLTKEHIIRTKILPYFGKLKISEISTKEVIAWQNEMLAYRDEKKKPYSQTYLKTLHNQLSAIFNHAVRYYELRSNPAAKVGNMGSEEHKEMLFWTKEEYKKFSFEMMDNSRTALDQNEYERRYADLAERYNTIKSEYDKISEQIESKKAQRELFKVFIRALEKQGALLEEFDEGLWSSLVQEVVVNAKDDIRFIFKNGFEIKTR